MREIKITTPENIEIEYTLAGLGSRTAAAVIDWLVILGIQLVILIIPLIIILSSTKWARNYYGWIAAISMVSAALIYYGYFIISEMLLDGRTIGKKALKIRVIRDNGRPITFAHSAIRNIFKLLVDLQGVGPVLIYFNSRHKRIGDILASTIVVMENEYTLPDAFYYNAAFQTKEASFLEECQNGMYCFLNDEERMLLYEYFARKDILDDRGEKLKEKILLYFFSKNVPGDERYAYQLFCYELKNRML